MPKEFMDRFYGAHRTYRFATGPDEVQGDADCDCSTFRSEEDLELFEDWMQFVHLNSSNSGLTEEEVKDSLHINIWKHEELYYLMKHRHELFKFLEVICQFEGKLPKNISFY